jgi:ubiquinone/menaquinone biosynthesis C-methylase UbiE
MDDSFLNPLQFWRGRGVASLVETVPAANPQPLPPNSLLLAEQLYAEESLLPAGRDPRPGDGAEPYTLQWFLDVEQQRHERYGRWLPRLMEFTKHAGDKLLGLDGGLGTDWVAFARGGAGVIACDSSTDRLALARRNFELRGLAGSFLHADPAALPLETSSIDVVCTGSLLHRAAQPQAVVRELYRVLKPGGKVIANAPAHYDMHFWSSFWFPWKKWFGRRRGDAVPLRYSRRDLCRLFQQFSEHRVSKRHLLKAETPHVWRWMPPGLLQRIAGRCLIVKAFKPLSAAMAPPLAA